MRVEIRKSEKAIIISFDTCGNRFDSNSERNRFFRELYGWNQTVPGNNKSYRYHRQGLLDQIPHRKISDSVFMVAMEHARRMEEFFDQWERKVEYDVIEVMMNRSKLEKMMKERMEENLRRIKGI